VVGVAVLIVAILALRNPKEASTAAGTDTRVSTVAPSVTPTSSATTSKSKSPTKKPTTSATSTAPSSAIGSKPLIVLNDTTTPDLAKDAANRFEGGGWNVTTFDENYSNNIISTAAYYDPDISGAEKAAKALQRQYPTIKRVVARFAELPAGPIVVVLTSDYSPN